MSQPSTKQYYSYLLLRVSPNGKWQLMLMLSSWFRSHGDTPIHEVQTQNFGKGNSIIFLGLISSTIRYPLQSQNTWWGASIIIFLTGFCQFHERTALARYFGNTIYENDSTVRIWNTRSFSSCHDCACALLNSRVIPHTTSVLVCSLFPQQVFRIQISFRKNYFMKEISRNCYTIWVFE